MTFEVFFAAALLFVVVLFVLLYSRRKGRSCDAYDERQQLIRGRAYRFGFFSTLVLGLAVMVAGSLGLYRFAAPSFCFFAALFGGIVAFAVYCVLRGAYLTAKDSFRSRAGLFGLIVVINAAVTVLRAADGELFEDGVLTLGTAAPALMAAGFLILLAALFIARARAKKEADE